jgi:hypothetical protein
VTQVSLILPEGWTNAEEAQTWPLTITANSSGLVHFKVRIPEYATEGKYNILSNSSVAQDKLTYSQVASLQLNTTLPKPALAGLNWNDVLVVVLIYTIPGIAIERVVETVWGFSKRRLKDDEIAKGNDALLEKLKARKVDPGQENTYRDIVGSYEAEGKNAKSRIAGWSIIVAFLFGLAPGAYFAFNGIGILQVLGFVGVPFQVYDMLLAAFSMSFVTKPTHDIIVIFEKIKNLGLKGGIA